MRIQDSRLLLKRSTTAGLEPTIPTGSTIHTDGTWNVEDIYAGELFLNMDDKKLWFGWEDISGNTGVTLVNPLGNLTGSCITDLFVENIKACDSAITLTADDTILNFVDNISDGYQFTAQYGYNSIFLDARNNPLTDASTIVLYPNNNIEIASEDIANQFTSRINLDSTQMSLAAIDATTTDASQIVIQSNQLTIESLDGSGNAGIIVNPAQVTLFSPNARNLTVDTTSLVYSVGSFVVSKDIVGNTTTNATPLSLDTIAFGGITDKVITVEAMVNGISSGSNKAYGAKLFAVFKNIGGTITQLSITDKSEKTDFTTATSDIVISGTDISIEVTGELATTIDWQVYYTWQIKTMI